MPGRFRLGITQHAERTRREVSPRVGWMVDWQRAFRRGGWAAPRDCQRNSGRCRERLPPRSRHRRCTRRNRYAHRLPAAGHVRSIRNSVEAPTFFPLSLRRCSAPGCLDRLHVLVGEAEMMAYLVHEDVGDDGAKRFVVLRPVVQDGPTVEPDAVRECAGRWRG